MFRQSAKTLNKRFLSGDVSAKEITETFLHRIATLDSQVQSFINVFEERALKVAEHLDTLRNKGAKLGPLAGVPIAIKDNIQLKGQKTTCASKILEEYRAPYDATACRLLEEAGAIFLGKTNLDEFAMGASCEKSAFFPTKNPWNLKHVPGGSSGGSAACVAARFTPISLGTDTGGSIRQPAAFCGIVGFKPTYGRVSRHGLVAFGSSLDQIGPMATNVEDIAVTMEVMGKKCNMDSTTINTFDQSYFPKIYDSLKGKKIGVPWKFLSKMSDAVDQNFKKSVEVLKDLGCEICDVDLDLLDNSIAVYYILATAEASTNLARFDGVRYGLRSSRAKSIEDIYYQSRHDGFGPEVKRRILLGTYVLSSGHQDAFYKKAQKVRTLFIEQYRNAFKKCDVIIQPTAPSSAFEIDGIQDPLQMYLQDMYTISPNLAGLPALSVPSGFDENKLPLGIQFIGPQREEQRVLNFGYQFEKKVNYSAKIPPLFGGNDE